MAVSRARRASESVHNGSPVDTNHNREVFPGDLRCQAVELVDGHREVSRRARVNRWRPEREPSQVSPHKRQPWSCLLTHARRQHCGAPPRHFFAGRWLAQHLGARTVDKDRVDVRQHGDVIATSIAKLGSTSRIPLAACRASTAYMPPAIRSFGMTFTASLCRNSTVEASTSPNRWRTAR